MLPRPTITTSSWVAGGYPLRIIWYHSLSHIIFGNQSSIVGVAYITITFLYPGKRRYIQFVYRSGGEGEGREEKN